VNLGGPWVGRSAERALGKRGSARVGVGSAWVGSSGLRLGGCWAVSVRLPLLGPATAVQGHRRQFRRARFGWVLGRCSAITAGLGAPCWAIRPDPVGLLGWRRAAMRAATAGSAGARTAIGGRFQRFGVGVGRCSAMTARPRRRAGPSGQIQWACAGGVGPVRAATLGGRALPSRGPVQGFSSGGCWAGARPSPLSRGRRAGPSGQILWPARWRWAGASRDVGWARALPSRGPVQRFGPGGRWAGARPSSLSPGHRAGPSGQIQGLRGWRRVGASRDRWVGGRAHHQPPPGPAVRLGWVFGQCSAVTAEPRAPCRATPTRSRGRLGWRKAGASRHRWAVGGQPQSVRPTLGAHSRRWRVGPSDGEWPQPTRGTRRRVCGCGLKVPETGASQFSRSFRDPVAIFSRWGVIAVGNRVETA
jgi:hypothetical protein